MKKEIQEKIIEDNNKKATEEEFANILKSVAPGTNLRAALNGVLKIKKGALIVVENEYMHGILDGGFRINTKFTPQKLIELSKMDGAIVLSKDMKKINYANVLLTPDSSIKTLETGTRHKAAERTAKHAATFVMAISERKNEINLFYKNIKYFLGDTDELLRKTNVQAQFLEKQRELFDDNIKKLNFLELRNYSSLNQAIQVIHKGGLIQKIVDDLKKHIIELGKEGTLLKIRLKELTKNVEKETEYVIKDYTKLNLKRSKILIDGLAYDEILDNEHILGTLGYEKSASEPPTIQGWRILGKTSLHEFEIARLINETGSLGKSLNSNPNFYRRIFGEEKAKILQEEINKIKLNNFANQQDY